MPMNYYAQVDFNKVTNDDLGEAEDRFQELFFEALKQKGIENYDRSVQALLKCIELDDSQSILYYELGKNYIYLKNFGAAEDALKKAIKLEQDNEWYLYALYGLYIDQKESDKAIKTLKELVSYHSNYKEDLVALYMSTKKYNEALKLLDELDAELGVSFNRDYMRNQIYEATGRKKDQIKNLEKRVENNPDKEANYLALIYRYSANNENEKAFETAKELLKINPNSQLVHLALYKFYLEGNNTDKAIESMKIVVKSPQIKPEAKLKVLSDFVKFTTKNPQYESVLIEATAFVADINSGESLIEMAQYYLTQGNKNKALYYYEQAIILDSDNFKVLRNILLLHIDLMQYDIASSKAKKALDKYPSQPILYLVNGVALNKLKKGKEALSSLEMGLDFIIDDVKTEIDFYNQISIAYSLLNNEVKAKAFSDKAKQLETPN